MGASSFYALNKKAGEVKLEFVKAAINLVMR